MIGAFLDRISGLFDRGLILGALFPLLIFGFILAASAASMIGWRASVFWLQSLSSVAALVWSMLMTLILFVFAFVLRSLRVWVLALWSGAAAPHWVIKWEANRRQKMEAGQRDETWSNVRLDFESERRDRIIPFDRQELLLRRVNDLFEMDEDPKRARRAYDEVYRELATAYARYDFHRLMIVYQRLTQFIEPRRNKEDFEHRTLQVQLALEFGPPGAIKGTRLGNILEALNSYPYMRYRMEGSALWPHLQQMMHGDLLEDVKNQQILLDFMLSLATLFLVLGGIFAFVGPWVWIWPSIPLVLVCVILSFVVYRFALAAAVAMSRALRAGCDLYRRDLLSALGCEIPGPLEDERAMWQQLSQLVLYGDTRGLVLRTTVDKSKGGEP